MKLRNRVIILLAIAAATASIYASPNFIIGNIGGFRPTQAQPNSQANYRLMEQAALEEMNRARVNPSAYATLLQNFKQYYRGKRLSVPNQDRILTREGVVAVDDAIAFLQKTQPMGELKTVTGLNKAAKDHVLDQGAAGNLGHGGSDGSKPSDRMNRYGRWERTAGENIAYGPPTGEQMVMQLIIDDGVLDRGHRLNIFNPAYQVTGIACGEHRVFRVMCVINYAGGYIDN